MKLAKLSHWRKEKDCGLRLAALLSMAFRAYTILSVRATALPRYYITLFA
ncbi:hypothetical protein [Parabacteroides faecis]|uniref:Uncharacterized protein n=1 Tax=Parabacteroides faecis TaxID=1217282 RepID=A0ABR6KP38_9BACT|nr:hypothetical protein [Parabacteroides faecis]MBB4623267.1 hypothetical protein [Parabacteroides faecis]